MKKMRERRFRLVIDVYWIVRVYVLKWQKSARPPAEEIRQLVGNSRLRSASRRLVEETAGKPELQRLALQLKERISRLERQEMSGTTAAADIQREQNRISEALLQLTEQLETEIS